MVTLTYFSRKVNMAYVQLVIGVSCLVTGLIPKDANIAIIVFYVIGKCFSGMGFLLVWSVYVFMSSFLSKSNKAQFPENYYRTSLLIQATEAGSKSGGL